MDEQIIKLFGDQISDLGRKVDKYHAEVRRELGTLDSELRYERSRVDQLADGQRTVRVWGLVALFAGGAGGSVISNLLL